MKNIMIIIDGMHDEKITVLDNLTPLEAAEAANIQHMKNKGSYGLFNTAPEGFNVDSLTCILTLLGQSKENIPSGRAYFEALAEGLHIKSNELIMRCNLISIDKDGYLKSSTGGNIGEEKYYELFKRYERVLEEEKFQMHHMSTYKNLLIIKNSKLDKVTDYPPHQNIGKLFNELIPKEKLLKEFVLQGIKALNDKEIRYGFLPWGLSKKEAIASFEKLHNIKSASVCHTEIVRGISIAMGMHTPKLKYATADIDTNLFEKANMTLELIKEYDFVLLHINGADEAAHRKDAREKTSFIKRVDSELIYNILDNIDEEVNVLVTSDHTTLCDNGSHKGDLQPFVIYNKKENTRKNLGIVDGKRSIPLMKEYK